MSDLKVGLKPGGLEFLYVPGRPLSFSMTLRQQTSLPGVTPVVRVPFTWPEAPQFQFGDVDDLENRFTKTAVLTDVTENSIVYANAKATWTFTALEIDEIDELPVEYVALVVDELPWWHGRTLRDD